MLLFLAQDIALLIVVDKEPLMENIVHLVEQSWTT
ncbi:hypothetical protein L284_20830 [Novosphingobium lindaniclasticum LE124]|uniref:Uncharacterized protein n=1 Tax=Novosphingobium lindaniclasticum LE124 TaxID=1096930 RepID=T0GXS1_9SPHN|nr:hypothetical protein L284_20830 [Novosphingobium lindaniclasticum LE124]